MDFPLFFLDHIGNRMLMAVVAIVHVLINHPFAVGAYPIVVLLEWWALRKGLPALDALARRITFLLFLITTTLGALTGVGIWLTAALIAPFGIGSLLRVFFSAWAFEWIIFIIEVILIVFYYVTWDKLTGARKKWHVVLGVALAAFSWITMAVITAILGFMMNPGQWVSDVVTPQVDLLGAILNPIYLPQLAFRTSYSMVTGGLMVLFMLSLFTNKESDLRAVTLRRVSLWILAWIPFVALGALWYWRVVPGFMKENVSVALLSMKFSQWHGQFLWIVAGFAVSLVLVSVWGAVSPRRVPTVFLLISFFMGLWILGHFERAREFVRKPYIIPGYMYANGVRVKEMPIFQRDGLLTYATYARHRTVTEENKIEAGEDIFLLACSRCHTSTGLNGVVNKFNALYGDQWDPAALKTFIRTMHTARPYMPPFPGSSKEAEALAAWLIDLKARPRTIHGAQSAGVSIPQVPNTATSDNKEGNP